MRTRRLVGYVWPGMIVAGIALATGVWALWPEQTARTIRLPYGEALPKTPRAPAPAEPETVNAAARTPAAVAPPSVEEPLPPAATVQAEAEAEQPEEAGRVLAVAEPALATKAKATEEVDERWGPDPIPSELDGLPGYEPELPEELGAEPLPGFTRPEPHGAG